MREIQAFLLEMYAVDVSPDLISTVTDAVVAEVTAWQTRPLEALCPVVFFDALRVKIRDEGTVRRKAVYLALGVLADGTRDILGVWIEQPRAISRRLNMRFLSSSVLIGDPRIWWTRVASEVRRTPMSKRMASQVWNKYQFIKKQSAEHDVHTMCRLLGVARSGYYKWLQKPVSDRAEEDARLVRLIRASFVASQGVYGAPRVFLDLREAGETCSKHRVARLMRENDLRALHGYRMRRWSVGKPSVLIPNLLKRKFTVTHPNKAWVTDITYIRTWQGWLYLAVVMDLFSRKIVGWSAQPTIRRELVLDAVLMAACRRKPRATIIHSDQGTQYGCDAWRRFCRSNHLEPSMSRKGNCWDNAVAESFFSSLKKERIKKQVYKNRELALADVADYIDAFYNRTRRHSHIGGVSPEQFEAVHRRNRVH